MNPKFRKLLKIEVEPTAVAFPAPVFIVGCMRSGTTFLVDKLTQHPQLLKVGAELRQLWTTLGKASCEEICEYKSGEEASMQVANDMTHYFSQFIRDAQLPQRYLMRAKAKLGRGQGSVFYDWEHIRPVNKSTQLVNKIGYLHALFPSSKIIFIVRSIYGQCSSMKAFIDHNYKTDGIIHHFPSNHGYGWTFIHEDKKTDEMKDEDIYPSNFSLIPRMWLRLNKLAFEHIAKLPPGLCAVVSYEDSVTHQAEVLEGLFDFLQLKPKHDQKAQKIMKSVLKYKNTTTQGNPLTKWKKYLNPEELVEIDQTIAENQASYDFIMDSIGHLKLSV